MFPILLASSSPRRRQLLEQVGFCVTVRANEVDESPEGDEIPVQLAERLARRKAEAALCDNAPGPRVGVAADTVVWTAGGTVLGKPDDAAHARKMLAELAGTSHSVTTGYCVFDRDAREVVAQRSVTTRVSFHPLDASQIDAYVRTDEPMGKAGGYAIQGLGAVLVREIAGCYTNVVGLPVASVVESLREVGLLSSAPWEGDAHH